jgi:endonuclease/exonuclease/phosphatase family metal-dependent hydrolase
MTGGRRFRVATWNIHSGIGADGRHDPQRIRETIRRFGASFTALQEVDGRVNGYDGFRDLSPSGAAGIACARTIRTGAGDYGHMLLSEWPLLRQEIYDLSVAGRESRSLIDAVADTGTGLVRVLSTHLGLSPAERRHQVARLLGLVHGESMPVVLLGDFNEPISLGPASRPLKAVFQRAGSWRTFPSRRPVFALDRIWCSHDLIVERSWVVRKARLASDHLPLLADLRLAAPGAAGKTAQTDS